MHYTLKSGRAEGTVSTLGGELISYRDAAGIEYVWTGDAKFWTGHAPVLFPIIGVLKNGKVNVGGAEIQMPKHGVARKREFTLVEKREDSAVFELKSDELTRSMFPQDFCLRVTHQISEQGFSTMYEVYNPASTPLKFCIGGHAGFCCPLHKGESFTDYELQFEKTEEPNPYYTDAEGMLHTGQRKKIPLQGNTLPLSYALFDDDVLIFDHVRSHSVKLRNHKTGAGIRFDFDGFVHLGLWTPPGKQAPFLCLEPWQGLPAFFDEDGVFEHKPDLLTCHPGEMMRQRYQMTIL